MAQLGPKDNVLICSFVKYVFDWLIILG